MLERLADFANQHDVQDVRIVELNGSMVLRVASYATIVDHTGQCHICSDFTYVTTMRELKNWLGY